MIRNSYLSFNSFKEKDINWILKRPKACCRCLYTELVLVLGLSDSQKQAQHMKGLKFGLSRNATMGTILRNIKAQWTRELVALHVSADTGQGSNLHLGYFHCYRCVNNNTLFCHDLSSKVSSPQFSISPTIEWWPMRHSQLVFLSI